MAMASTFIPNNSDFSRKTNSKQEYEPSNFVFVPSLLFFLLKIYEPETILAAGVDSSANDVIFFS